MRPRSRSAAFGAIAVVVGVACWLGVIAARWDRVESIAFSILVVALIAAGYFAWFARSTESRNWWYGFAVFGMFHLLSPSFGPRQPLISAGVDLIANQTLGKLDEYGNLVQDENGRWTRPTRLGKFLGTLPVTRDGSPQMSYPQYVRSVTKLFASLVFAWIGAWAATHLGRHGGSDEAPTHGRSRVPKLGLAAMVLIALFIGFTFVLDSRPDFYQPGWFPISPGCLAGHFALYQIECVIVLCAALESRFGDRTTRAWWFGFALFGGVYLLLIDTPLFALLPSRWLSDWHQALLERFVADRSSQIVNVRGMILMDVATQEFFRLGYSWVPLFGFLPAAWVGSGVARGGARLSQRRTPETRRRRSTIFRLMLAVGTLALFLAAARAESELWLALVGDTLAAVFLGASLYSALGKGQCRAWWFGFALVGGVDLLLFSTRAGINPFNVVSSTPWPPHYALERLLRAEYERSIGKVVQMALWGDPHPKEQAIFDAYQHARSVLLMGSSLPLAWLGATLARWMERRHRILNT